MAMLTNSRNFSTRTEAAKATRVVVPPRFEKRGSPTSRYLLVAEVFQDSAAVNEALRLLTKIAKSTAA